MDKGCDLTGVISDGKARANQIGEIAAVQACAGAIAKDVPAEVCLDTKVMKKSDSDRALPAVQIQPLRVRIHALWQLKVEIGIAAEYVDRGKALGGSDAEKKESCQSDAN